MDELTNLILNEYNYDFKIESVVAKYGLDQVIQTIANMFSMHDHNRHVAATIFMRDIYLGSDLSKKTKSEYISKLQTQKVFDYFLSFLYSGNCQVRYSTIYTVGKLSQKEFAYQLKDAFFRYYLFHDPISAYKTLFEICWLTGNSNLNLLRSLITHPNELFVWFSIEFDDAQEKQSKLFKKEYRYPILEELEGCKLENSIRKQKKGSLKSIALEGDSHKVYPTHFDLEISFLNTISHTKAFYFGLSELELFAEYYVKNHKVLREHFLSVQKEFGSDHVVQEEKVKEKYLEIAKSIWK